MGKLFMATILFFLKKMQDWLMKGDSTSARARRAGCPSPGQHPQCGAGDPLPAPCLHPPASATVAKAPAQQHTIGISQARQKSSWIKKKNNKQNPKTQPPSPQPASELVK